MFQLFHRTINHPIRPENQNVRSKKSHCGIAPNEFALHEAIEVNKAREIDVSATLQKSTCRDLSSIRAGMHWFRGFWMHDGSSSLSSCGLRAARVHNVVSSARARRRRRAHSQCARRRNARATADHCLSQFGPCRRTCFDPDARASVRGGGARAT